MACRFGVTRRSMYGKRSARYLSKYLGMVAEQRMSFFKLGAALSRISVVKGLNERSNNESASSITRCVTRERILGLLAAMLARRGGVLIRTSTPFSLNRRLRITVALFFA